MKGWMAPLRHDVPNWCFENKTARIAWAVMLREKEYQPRAVAA
jgi:hypothetical protein